MSELTDFLLARITEDEARARAATPGPWIASGQDDYWEVLNLRGSSMDDVVVSAGWPSDPAGGACEKDADHIARWNPARVLAECDTKRRIVTNIGVVVLEPFGLQWPEGYREALEHTLRLLALPYADHSEYRSEWAP
jgi:hypothetical protein